MYRFPFRKFQFVDCSTLANRNIEDEDDCVLITNSVDQENPVDPLDVDALQVSPDLSVDEEDFQNFLNSIEVEDSDKKHSIQTPVINIVKKENIKQELSSDGGGIMNFLNKHDAKNPNSTRLVQNKPTMKQEPLLRILKPEQIKPETIDPYFIKKEPTLPFIKQENVKKEPIVPFIKEESIAQILIKPEPCSEESDSEVYEPPCESDDFSNINEWIPATSETMTRTEQPTIDAAKLRASAISESITKIELPTAAVDAAKLRLAEIIKQQILQSHTAKSSHIEESFETNREEEEIPSAISSRAKLKCYQKVACEYCGEMKAFAMMKLHQNSAACRAKRKPLNGSTMNGNANGKTSNVANVSDQSLKTDAESLQTSSITTRLRSNHKPDGSYQISEQQKSRDNVVTSTACGRSMEERLMAYHPCLINKSVASPLSKKPSHGQNSSKAEMKLSKLDESPLVSESQSETLAPLERLRKKSRSSVDKSSSVSQLDPVPKVPVTTSKTQGKGVKNPNKSRTEKSSSKEIDTDSNKSKILRVGERRREQESKSDSTRKIHQAAVPQNTKSQVKEVPNDPVSTNTTQPPADSKAVDRPKINTEFGVKQESTDKKPVLSALIQSLSLNNSHHKKTCKHCEAIVRIKEMSYHRKTQYCRSRRKEKQREKAKKAQSDKIKKEDSSSESDEEKAVPTPPFEAASVDTISKVAEPQKQTPTTEEYYSPNDKKPCPDCEDLVTVKLLSHHQKSKICQAKREYLEYQKKNGTSITAATSGDTKPTIGPLEEYNPNKKEPCPDCNDLVTTKSLTHHRRSWSCQAKKKYFELHKNIKEQGSNPQGGNACKEEGEGSRTDTKPTVLLEYNPNRKEPCPDCQDLVMVRAMSHHRRSWTCQAKKQFLDKQQAKIFSEQSSDSSSFSVKDEKGTDKCNIEEDYDPNEKKPCPDCRDMVTVKLLSHHQKSWTCRAKKKYFEEEEEKKKGRSKKSSSAQEVSNTEKKDAETSDSKGQTPCLVCGDLVEPKSMAVHQKTTTCLAIGKYKEAQKRGIKVELDPTLGISNNKDKGKEQQDSSHKPLQMCNPNEKMPCPDCGDVLTVRSIPRHRQSFSCIARRGVKKEKRDLDDEEPSNCSDLPGPTQVKTGPTLQIKMEEEEIIDTGNLSQESSSQEIQSTPPEVQSQSSRSKIKCEASLENDNHSDSETSACSSGFESMEEPPIKKRRRSCEFISRPPEVDENKGSGV